MESTTRFELFCLKVKENLKNIIFALVLIYIIVLLIYIIVTDFLLYKHMNTEKNEFLKSFISNIVLKSRNFNKTITSENSE